MGSSLGAKLRSYVFRFVCIVNFRHTLLKVYKSESGEKMPKVLLIDDDERLAAPLKEYMGRFELRAHQRHPPAGWTRNAGQGERGLGNSGCDAPGSERIRCLPYYTQDQRRAHRDADGERRGHGQDRRIGAGGR